MIDGAVVSRVSSFFSVGLSVAFRNMRDRAAQIQENEQKARNDQAPFEQKARNDQAPSAPGRFSLFHRFSLLASVSLFVWVAIFSGQPKKSVKELIRQRGNLSSRPV